MYSQMSTHVPGVQSFFRFFASFILAKLATSSIRVNDKSLQSHFMQRSMAAIRNDKQKQYA